MIANSRYIGKAERSPSAFFGAGTAAIAIRVATYAHNIDARAHAHLPGLGAAYRTGACYAVCHKRSLKPIRLKEKMSD